MPVQSTDDSIPRLQKTEDYPRWAQYATEELLIQNCEEGIHPAKFFTRADKIASLKSYGFADEDITETMVSDSIGNDIMRQDDRRDKAAEILRKLVGLQNQRLIANKDAEQIWSILREEFQDVTPWSLLEVIRNACFHRMSDFADVNEYCNAYQEALGQVCSMLQPDSVIDRKGAEAMLLLHMLSNVDEFYRPLVFQVQRDWTSANTDLFEACTRIRRYRL